MYMLLSSNTVETQPFLPAVDSCPHVTPLSILYSTSRKLYITKKERKKDDVDDDVLVAS